jgi:hypothetical protein
VYECIHGVYECTRVQVYVCMRHTHVRNTHVRTHECIHGVYECTRVQVYVCMSVSMVFTSVCVYKCTCVSDTHTYATHTYARMSVAMVFTSVRVYKCTRV